MMLDSSVVAQLFQNVLQNDALLYNLSPESIKFGIECMAHVYKGETLRLNLKRSEIADYTDPAHRCAYLHKYAALHTSLVRDMLCRAIRENFNFFYELVFSREPFKFCSLGGGPGTDIIGALAALHAAFSYFDVSVTVVDYMVEWRYSFESILKELGTGMYGAFGNNISHFLDWQYVRANLLKTYKPEVIEALSTASLVTMIKFASAAACVDTYLMIKNIFANMKPGGVLLFIDNDGGGFHNLIMDTANEFNFISIFGPLRQESYLNSFCKKKRFGYSSCYKTTVTVHILQKPVLMNPCNFSIIRNANQNILGNRRVILENNNYMSNRPSLLGSPPTPLLYLGESLDKNANWGYVSPIEEIPQSPSPHNVIMRSHVATPLTSHLINSPLNVRMPANNYTPSTQHRGGKRARMRGCLPFQINNFRHHVAKKVNQFKARAHSAFKKRKNKKKNKNHPVFEL